jgi:hypothetical protein
LGPILAQVATSLVMAFIWGPTPMLLMELFPVGVRSTGVELIYNVAVALFGGLAPSAIAENTFSTRGIIRKRSGGRCARRHVDTTTG